MFSVLKSTLPLFLATLTLSACGQSLQPTAVRIPAQPIRMVQPVASVSLLLKFKPEISRNEKSLLLSEYNLSLKQNLDAINVYVVLVPPSAPLSLLEKLKADQRLSYVESNSALSRNPGFTLAGQPSRFLTLIGKQVELEGIYTSDHQGASLMLAEGEELTLVSQESRVLETLPGIETRSRIRMKGIIRPFNANLSKPVALMPLKYQRI
ncbi:hypothetical protein COW36_03865 [bacterium (Candidatus Blackallbacteria) CG17_big_fil_post_rev_8_21_14_2_50_48_46]|uniref:Uncharacterized protein n=1 Tax=bacterium (Candidatus Blackallbacteria) CG17_big_fil_post_rev_8_21_14_2_50_48_46 TaxID=2014261 RepID=A0A2M7G8J9_9BACT|nr:MAG: hypothetical protein COW64_05080 [bacterium (Candidatus Blackallbacteria) CG18_big_fil_WC_8_21_14_2_50_49_26]PIW18436.1 MAG: hypothetical protein COW36_03865 [bacterium (Candidatus Blackallbacteria) CG17_big_fil_post_rev_8_21_14_2_50_48_46]PIW46579.1 MAG: hypothetical protein COW20_16815 [bacterium (Candidatus Blackallbacteria) CG13_big_fil_rev_8_21_14_2_50_49_14]